MGRKRPLPTDRQYARRVAARTLTEQEKERGRREVRKILLFLRSPSSA